MIVDATLGKPILDVACGSGRNAIFLSRLGCTVICMDKDLTRLCTEQSRWRRPSFKKASTRLVPHKIDFIKDPWPFGARAIGGIVNVHFFSPTLFCFFENSLSPGGYLLLETVPGCGENYLELPKTGDVRLALEKGFDFEFYRERRVGPRDYDAVTVQMLAKRRA